MRRTRGQTGEIARGIATLEMALSVPFLLLSIAIGFSFGMASLGASTAAVKARHDAWRQRDGMHGSDVFNMAMEPGSDVASRSATKQFKTSAALGLAGNRAESKNAVLAAAWDHDDAPFADPGAAFRPHIGHIEQLARGVASGASLDVGALAQFAGLGDLGSNDVVSSALSGVGGDLGGALGSVTSSSGFGDFPVDKLSKVGDIGSSAGDLKDQVSGLTSKASSGTSGSIGGVQQGQQLSKGMADAQNAALGVGKAIFEGIDDALHPLQKVIDGLNSVVGDSKKSGGVVGTITDPIKKAAQAIIKEVLGLFGEKDAAKEVEKMVNAMDRIDTIGTSCFGNLVKAADDSDDEGDWISLGDDLKAEFLKGKN